MELSNSLETIVYCHLIREMICLGHRDDFLMMSTLVCMVTHWTRPTVNYDIDYQIIMI